MRNSGPTRAFCVGEAALGPGLQGVSAVCPGALRRAAPRVGTAGLPALATCAFKMAFSLARVSRRSSCSCCRLILATSPCRSTTWASKAAIRSNRICSRPPEDGTLSSSALPSPPGELRIWSRGDSGRRGSDRAVETATVTGLAAVATRIVAERPPPVDLGEAFFGLGTTALAERVTPFTALYLGRGDEASQRISTPTWSNLSLERNPEAAGLPRGDLLEVALQAPAPKASALWLLIPGPPPLHGTVERLGTGFSTPRMWLRGLTCAADC
mmetsp:Transcript_45356/g.74648  ORF Transcript_45356/g.74648 Transcript_45356/m.74648 type:complete len:270 (-) Transcript_45356:174-983(-)